MNEADRQRLSATLTRPSTLETVAEAIARLGDRSFIKVYVERSGSSYRWSIAHRGGPYPLLREVARYLELPHTEVLIPVTSIDGWSVVAAADERAPVDASGFIEPSSDPTEVITRLAATLGQANPSEQGRRSNS